MNKIRSLVTWIPELTILLIVTFGGYIVMGLFSQMEGTEVLGPFDLWLIIVGSFLISTGIAVLAVIGGIGGGVIFTPIMLAFTSMDTLIIRATGLVVAMFSGLISSGPFMRKGLSDIKIVLFCAVPIVIGALIGSTGAVFLRTVMDEKGDAIVRLLLGVLMIVIAYFLITKGGKIEYPESNPIDRISAKLGLSSAYWEESLNKTIEYNMVRAVQGWLLFILLGLIGGFFGIGGGAFLTGTLNLVMMVPIKVSAACSGVLLAISNACAIWTYMMYGALIAIFVAPWLLGQVIGGIIGAHILISVKAGFVRIVLIGILLASCIKLVFRGIEGLFTIDIPFF
ncbi:sulfite exporter TauE/SafE family protein [Thermodesulfobacteriota bacterium]